MKLHKDHIPKLEKAHRRWGLKEIHITDTIPQIPEILNLDFMVVHSLARRFAGVINRMHYNQSVSKLFEERESY
jgi:phosphoribosylpyrophosphate synthetase